MVVEFVGGEGPKMGAPNAEADQESRERKQGGGA